MIAKVCGSVAASVIACACLAGIATQASAVSPQAAAPGSGAVKTTDQQPAYFAAETNLKIKNETGRNGNAPQDFEIFNVDGWYMHTLRPGETFTMEDSNVDHDVDLFIKVGNEKKLEVIGHNPEFGTPYVAVVFADEKADGGTAIWKKELTERSGAEYSRDDRAWWVWREKDGPRQLGAAVKNLEIALWKIPTKSLNY